MTIRKPVTFVAGGTRGDVQPYVVLAQALRQHGIDAQVAASARWRPLVEEMRVPYRALPADPVELLLQPRFQAALTLTHGVGVGMRATWAYLREMRPYVTQLQRQIPQLYAESRAIVAGVASQWIAQPSLWESIPLVWGLFQPVAPTRDFASPMGQTRVPNRLNRLSHVLMNRMMWLSWQLHGLAPGGGLAHINAQPAFFAFSRQLVPAWSDMAPHHEITGWLGSSGVAQSLTDELQHFLADDTPYVIATFGTPAANESYTLYAPVIAACQRLGIRLLLQVPDHLGSMNVPAGVTVVSTHLDHQRWFARASAVIHHGGAGTTHACLAAGVPMIIVPRGIDQFFWAARVHAAELTPVMIDRRQYTANVMIDALARLTDDPQYRQRMRSMQLYEGASAGIESATRFIQRYIR